MLFKVSHNSEQNNCARFFFLVKLQVCNIQLCLVRGNRHRCFTANFAKFLIPSELQKHLFASVLQNRVFFKFREIQRKAPVTESLFSKVTGLQLAVLSEKRLGTDVLLRMLQSFKFASDRKKQAIYR